MPSFKIKHLVLATVMVPLALGLAACKKTQGEDNEVPAATAALPKVAPPAGKAWTDVIDTNTDGGVIMGNPNAPIKLVEYGSLSCPHCAKLAQEGFAKLTGDYVTSGRVSLEFRSFAIHPQDVPLTVLAQCAGKETFFPLAEQLYSNFDSIIERMQKPGTEEAMKRAQSLPKNQYFPAISDAMGLTEFFAARGVSVDQAHACLADMTKVQAVADHSEAYGKSGVDSTPTLFINASKIEGNTWAELEAALQRAGAR